MAVQDILKKIKTDAEVNASDVVAEGKAAGQQVLTVARRDIDAQKEKLLSRARQHADEERNRIITLAHGLQHGATSSPRSRLLSIACSTRRGRASSGWTQASTGS